MRERTRARRRARGYCFASFLLGYAATQSLSPIWLGLALATIGFAAGLVGLFQLRRFARARAHKRKRTALDRVRAKLALEARRTAFAGLGVCGLILGLFALYVGVREVERATDPDRAPAEVDREAEARSVLAEIASRTETPVWVPSRPLLSEREIARRLRAFLREYGDTFAAQRLRTIDRQPYPTFRRILREWSGTPEMPDGD